MLGLLTQIARIFALLSVVSIGGANAVLPEICRQVVVVQGWMSAEPTAFLDDLPADERLARRCHRFIEHPSAQETIDFGAATSR